MPGFALDRDERPRRRPSRKKRFQSTEFFLFEQRLANTPRLSPDPINFALNDELRPQIKADTKAREISGQKLTAAEGTYWLQHHAQRQRDIIMEAWGLKMIIDEEGYTPRVIALLDQKSKAVPDDWKYGVKPGSKAYVEIKKNEQEFLKWRALARAGNRKTQRILTREV